MSLTEADCKYVCSRGILKSCDIHSSNPISSIYHINGYNKNITNIENNTVLYICSSAIPFFIKNILPTINTQFILVSGDCDETIPNDIFNSQYDYLSFVNDNRLIHWFCQNFIENHPKITLMPIGLDYHTMSNGDSGWGKQTAPYNQEELLEYLHKTSKPFYERKLLCYSNFHFFMTTKYGYDRQDAVSKINKELVYYEPIKVQRLQSWKKQCDYAYVISPHGNGLDCHRTWEALCLGCIPIVKTSKIDKLYDDLPVLIVKDWTDINTNLLKNTVEEFKHKNFNYDKLTLKYWVNLINSYKK